MELHSSGNRPFGEVAGQLEQWIAEHGRLPSGGITATAAERGLAVWIAGQRQRYRLDTLAPGAVAALVAILGWTWQARPRRSGPAQPHT
ncbi:MAG: helicase associated domain-containing protein [Nakamurella sp.]